MRETNEASLSVIPQWLQGGKMLVKFSEAA
jgi:hypothetical protein